MLVLEKLASFSKDVARRATDLAYGTYSVRVFISNTAGAPLVLVPETHTAQGLPVTVSFHSLEPGRAGLVHGTGRGELGFAVALSIDGECLMLGAHNSRTAAPSFTLAFKSPSGGAGVFYKSMPRGFTGAEGRSACVEGERYAAFVGHVVQGAQTSVHVLVGPRSEVVQLPKISRELTLWSCVAPRALESSALLGLAEQCMGRTANLAQSVFLLEFGSIVESLGSLALRDQAFILDVCAAAFVLSGLLGLDPKVLKPDVERRQERMPDVLQRPGATGSLPLPLYDDYRAFASEGDDVPKYEAYVDAVFLLLSTAALQSGIALQPCLRTSSSASSGDAGGGPRWGTQQINTDQDTNCDLVASHLSQGQHAAAPPGRSGDGQPALSADAEAGVKAAAQQCIHDAAEFTWHRRRVLEALEGALRDESQRAPLRHYSSWVPPLRRRFGAAGTAHLAEHEAWGPELLAGLDGGKATGPQQLIESLGHGAPPYKTMSTNSKSGEFFFFSGDRHFLIKTVTKDEAMLLFRMLPAYQHHVKYVPKSFIVRYAGLHRARIPGIGDKYFTIMVSVFDPTCKIHETFDVKGSMLNRKMKPGESIGKDEDWVASDFRLQLPDAVRREVRAAHEQDAAFLAAFGVMDYSLLIGVHRPEPSPGGAASSALPTAGWREPAGGLWAVGGGQLYFVGLIDFLIAFGLYKQAENLLRVAQGHGEDASCVDPLSYATRQVRFVQDRVLAAPRALPEKGATRRAACQYGRVCYRMSAQHKLEFAHPGDPDWVDSGTAAAVPPEDQLAAGTLGTLRVTVVEAHKLRNADRGFRNVSDPYVEVALGLQRAKTPSVQNCLDPKWNNCVLRLAVDEMHTGSEVELTVWDEDTVRQLQGSDDFLGRLRVPLESIMRHGPVALHEALQGVDQGMLTAQLEFVPGPAFKQLWRATKDGPTMTRSVLAGASPRLPRRSRWSRWFCIS